MHISLVFFYINITVFIMVVFISLLQYIETPANCTSAETFFISLRPTDLLALLNNTQYDNNINICIPIMCLSMSITFTCYQVPWLIISITLSVIQNSRYI